MLAKKCLTPAATPSQYRRELENLYARISNIDALIEFLEQYRQFQSEDRNRSERKTA
jgi:hypothetical protein